MGFEPTRPRAADFKSAAAAVTPSPRERTRSKCPETGSGHPEATTGFEPVMGVLQTSALPLGYVAQTSIECWVPSAEEEPFPTQYSAPNTQHSEGAEEEI